MSGTTVIIGAKGTLGQSFAELYKEQNPLLWDREELDIGDEQAVQAKLAEAKPQLVINCAAYNAVDKAEQEPEVANLINGYAVGFLAKACKDIGATLIHFTSNYIFDGKKREGYSETDQPNPISKYGESKLLGETEAQKYGEKFYIIRSAWLYGKPGISAASKTNYVDRILQIAQEKDTLEGVSDQYGQPTYTKDLAEASKALYDTHHPYGIYHLVNEGEATWYSWAEEILKIKDIAKKLVENQMANFNKSGHSAPRPQYGILLNTKFIKLRPWQEALAEYLSPNS